MNVRLQLPAAQPTPRVLVGKYRLEERLDEGATGVVYRAVHLGLQKAFAVKLLKPSPDPLALARFRREAEALGQLRHPNIVEVTDFGVDPAGGTPYLVMELLEGRTLADLCRETGPLPLPRALPILEAIAEAVDAAHARGVLHRDLKPGNILLGTQPDGAPLVKVLDFGLAELAGAPVARGEGADRGGPGETVVCQTATGALIGTPLYAAPEVIRQQPARRASDRYSFGVIAYEVLAGRPPFRGSVAEVLAGHLEREPPRPAALPDEVWEALRSLLAKDPNRRPPSARTAVRRLWQAAERAELARWRAIEIPRRAGLSALLAAVLVLAAVLPWPELSLELWLRDLRLRAAPPRAPDSRILLVTLDDSGPAGGEVSLADRAEEIGSTLARILAAGARGLAINLLLHPTWAESPAFSDLAVRSPDALTLAAFSEPDGRVTGTECVAGLSAAALGPERAASLFGFVNLDEDADGITRRGRLRFVDRSGRERLSWAAKAAAALRPLPPADDASNGFWIDHRIDWPRYDRISWREVPAVLARHPERFRGRLVLVGNGFLGSGDDYHRVPRRGETAAVSGLTLQALLVDTLAAGRPVREIDGALLRAAAALLTGLAMTGILCGRRPARFAGSLAALAGLYITLSFPAFGKAGWMLPVSSPVVLALAGLVLALMVRRMRPPAPEVSS